MEKNELTFRVLPARHGMAWVMQSLTLFRAQPARLLFLAVLLQLILGLTQVPLLGLLVILAIPALSAGLLEAFHDVGQGYKPGPRTLFTPLSSASHTGRLLTMGALMLLVGVITVSLVLSGSEELLKPDLLARIEKGDIEALRLLNPETISRIALALVLGVSISGTISYFAIPLIWFRNCSLGQALNIGMKALFSNWKSFLALALTLVLLFMPMAIIGGILFGFVGSPGAMSAIILGLVMILMLAFQLVLFGTQYCAFREIFGVARAPGQPDSSKESQLVA